MQDLLLVHGDKHHIYPRKHLKIQGHTRGSYNQIANFVITQSEINIAIGAKPPEQYFSELVEQCNGGEKRYGGIAKLTELKANLADNCIPESVMDGETPDYEKFLTIRRKLMALKIRVWFDILSK